MKNINVSFKKIKKYEKAQILTPFFSKKIVKFGYVGNGLQYGYSAMEAKDQTPSYTIILQITKIEKTSRNLRKNIRKSSPNHQILQNFNFCAGNLEKIEKPREIFKKFSKNHRQISKFYKILIFVQEIFRKLQKPRVFFKKSSPNHQILQNFNFCAGNLEKIKKKPREIFKKKSKNYQKIYKKSSPSHPTRGIPEVLQEPPKFTNLSFFLIFFKNPKN